MACHGFGHYCSTEAGVGQSRTPILTNQKEFIAMEDIDRVHLIIGNECDEQMEFLLGRKLPKKYKGKLGRCFHLTTGNQGVLNALEYMGLTIEDVIYPEDREVLKAEAVGTDK